MKKIDIKIYGDGKKEKAYSRTIYCDNCDECGLYQMGKCLRIRGFLADERCKYGKAENLDGYTKKAQKYCDWRKKIIDDPVYGKLHRPYNCYAAVIGDYIWLNLIYTKIFERTKDNREYEFQELGWDIRSAVRTGACFVPKKALTPKLLARALSYNPHALFGGVIEEYQRKIVPAVITDLKKIVPDLMKKVMEISSNLDCEDDYIGRTAYVNTLATESILTKKGTSGTVYGVYTLHRENGRIFLKGESSEYHFGSLVKQTVEFDVADDMTYTIDDNAQVTPETKFV